MLEAATLALQQLLEVERLGFLFLGVLMGLALGAIPGLGGIIGLAILLPFTFDMEPVSAFAMIMGLISVTATSDTIPAVLFGVPGTSAAAATIMDGHPMAKQGQAGRALGAAYMSSLLGGLFGALVLAASVPILRPVVLAFGVPEFFMMGMLGISMVAVLGGRAPLKGLVMGFLGIWIGAVGLHQQTGFPRWTFGEPLLWEGMPLIPVVLGIFAIPEALDLMAKGTRISDVPAQAMRGQVEGIKDALRHWSLVLRCSAIGTWIGFLPGLGGNVADWMAYGHAVSTARGRKDTFGKGDVRGVIAPESANNAVQGGGLIPTIAFGVPGTAAMALVIAAFAIHGFVPGPDLLTKRLDFTFLLAWSVAIANLMGAGVCLLLTPQLAKLATINVHKIVPFVLSIVVLASFQESGQFTSVWILLIFSVFGWLMKRFDWPRPPLILGFVLSPIIENNLFISVSRFGLEWLGRPIVLLLLVLAVASLYMGLRSQGKRELIAKSEEVTGAG